MGKKKKKPKYITYPIYHHDAVPPPPREIKPCRICGWKHFGLWDGYECFLKSNGRLLGMKSAIEGEVLDVSGPMEIES